ncbi:M23 family metallopeptidase [Agromyces mangrovi Wang et al. 2018]|uniref:M23 family metallopeptidase n=1 Tax=Agromyces mangrovi TaxID=1858653 RepID=UPI0025724D0E|nr:M23 family metallopeptidase [Agromyces mangrovi]BDZ66281.1 hypothetical protein GCM10025877_32190 [Agromyces mangrovi]
MGALTDFYRNPTLSDGFGSTLPPRTNPHRGLDFPHALGTPVPAYSPGVVVTSQEHPVLGVIVQVKGRNGRFVGYRHLRRSAPRLDVGARVRAGTIIGQVSDTGSAAHPFHHCTTNSSNARGVFGELGVEDPWPFIQRTIRGVGYTGPVDGRPGPETCRLVQVYARKFGDYTGAIDRKLGPNGWAGFAKGLERS